MHMIHVTNFLCKFFIVGKFVLTVLCVFSLSFFLGVGGWGGSKIPTTVLFMMFNRGLQKLVVVMLVALFEKDPHRVWTFERLFQETQEILEHEVTTVLALFAHHSPFDTVYLPHFNRLVPDSLSVCTLGLRVIDLPHGKPAW